MWKCPACGETIEDRYDSCWQCAKVEPEKAPADGHGAERAGAGFWRAWCRGWLVLLMMVVTGVVAGLVRMFLERSEGPLEVAGIGVAIVILPALAYWIFVLFFGREAWPLPSGAREISRDEKARLLLEEATRLEARGRVKEALETYQKVVEGFDGTDAGRDAQKSLESLRARIG